jgi:hypothetical protein
LEEIDKAERLHNLIERLKEIAVNVKINDPQGRARTLHELELWRTLNPMAQHIGMEDDRALRDAFVNLCTSIKVDIQSISFKKESVRTAWLSRLDDISKVFLAKNFGTSTSEAFGRHFISTNLEVLDSISERFRAAGLKESSDAELTDALAAVRDAIEALIASGGLDQRIAALLSHYLQQMETVYAQASDFGDEIFWKIYKETFATFAQIHPIIAELENADEVKGKLQVVFQKLTSKSIAGVSLGANLATLGATLYPLLG